jgi:putative effector of murein hydrolase LrgA (UPF0299 family)
MSSPVNLASPGLGREPRYRDSSSHSTAEAVAAAATASGATRQECWATIASVTGSPLQGLAWLLVFQAVGEALSRALDLPFPGPVVGMLLLLGALGLPAVREPVGRCADFLLAHLSLLFVPVGVGVLAHLDLLASFGGRMIVVIVVSTWAGMIATLWTLRRVGEAEADDQPTVDQALEDPERCPDVEAPRRPDSENDSGRLR